MEKSLKRILTISDDEERSEDLRVLLGAEFQVTAVGGKVENAKICGKVHQAEAIVFCLSLRVTENLHVLDRLCEYARLFGIPIIAAADGEDAAFYERNREVFAENLFVFDLGEGLFRAVRCLCLLISDARRAEQKRWSLEKTQIVLKDAKTGIYNKQAFCCRAAEIIARVPERSYVLVRWDIDYFKVFNDTYGVEEGDRLLAGIGRQLRENRVAMEQKGEILFGYWDADHFVMLWDGARLKPDGLWHSIMMQVRLMKKEFNLQISMGFYRLEKNRMEIATACDRALLALRSVKNNYERHYAWYHASMRDRMLEEQSLVSEMHEALLGEQFALYFQPQYHYASGQMTGAEVLVRWEHPERGLIAPDRFIPVFEKNGFIFELDKYIWERSCLYVRQWMADGLCVSGISVNISRVDMNHEDFLSVFQGLRERYPAEAALLRLEITESAYMENAEHLIHMVNQLKGMGFVVEMDDFGSGYSSLNVLKDVPMDVLKIDMKFLVGGDCYARGGNILRSIINMAHSIGMSVIAEGVETKQQAEFLKGIGCKYMQGYFFSRPVAAKEFRELIEKTSCQPVITVLE